MIDRAFSLGILTVVGEPQERLKCQQSRRRNRTFFFAAQKALCQKGKDGMPTLASLIALTKYLTGRDPTPIEIERARVKYEKFLAERAVQEAATSVTAVAPAKSQPRPSTEDENAAEASQSRCDPTPTSFR
jgi:hypothetical protein